jgi:hypothetical protein
LQLQILNLYRYSEEKADIAAFANYVATEEAVAAAPSSDAAPAARAVMERPEGSELPFGERGVPLTVGAVQVESSWTHSLQAPGFLVLYQ